MGETLRARNSASEKRGQAPCAYDSSHRRWTDTCNFFGDGVLKKQDQKTVADAGTSAFTGGPKHSDRDLLIQQLMETICPPTLVAQERSSTNDLETPLLNWFPVETVTEEDIIQPELLSDSTEGCVSCGEWTHTTEQCQTLDESFPFLPIGWVSEHNEDRFILGPGPPSSPRSHQTGNDD